MRLQALKQDLRAAPIIRISLPVTNGGYRRMAEEKLTFQTEVSRLLHIVANSLYSEKQIFLRELISNASDACDRLRYEAITNPDLTTDDPEFRVCIAIDKKAQTIEIADNGIGMNHDDLVQHLGTIARSGTEAFL